MSNFIDLKDLSRDQLLDLNRAIETDSVLGNVRVPPQRQADDLLQFSESTSPPRDYELENLEKQSELEEKIYKVRIKHDGSPETNTATVILDARESYDPNKVDKLIFEWAITFDIPLFCFTRCFFKQRSNTRLLIV